MFQRFPTQRGFVRKILLDNNYFELLIRRRNQPTDLFVQDVAENGLAFWRNDLFRALKRNPGGRGGTRNGRDGGGGEDGDGAGRRIMLNVDMALIVDLAQDASLDPATGEVDCEIGRGTNPCPISSTIDTVANFSQDNGAWLIALQAAFDIMMHKGCTTDPACEDDLCTRTNA